MPYIGQGSDGFGIRRRYFFTASAGDTSLSANDSNGLALKFSDGSLVDVYLNGVLLDPNSDYNTTTANTIGGLASLAANDIVEIIVYDVFSVANTVAQTGGTYSGDVAFSTNISVTGTSTLTGAQTLTGTTSATQIDIEGETLLEERAIMLEGTDSDFSNEGSLLLLDASASGTDAGEKLLFEANTLDSLTKEDPDVIVLEVNDEMDFYFKTQTQTQEYLQLK